MSPRDCETSDGAGPSGWQSRCALASLAVAAAIAWLALLPLAARRERFAARWQRLESAGIDPAAMTYRELPVAEAIYAQLQARPADRWRSPP
jgi:hypothetical protein